MPVLEHVFAAIFNFVAFPQIHGYPTGSPSKASSFKYPEKQCEKADFRTRPRRTAGNGIASGPITKRSKMEAFRRRTRVFSMSLPAPPPSVAGPPSSPQAKEVQTPQQPNSAPPRQGEPGPLAIYPSLPSTPPIRAPTAQASDTTSEVENARGVGVGEGENWAAWANEADVVGSTSAEGLTRLAVNGDRGALPIISTGVTTRSQEKKGVKRKRSEASLASLSSTFHPLSKKLSGLVTRTSKKARTAAENEPGSAPAANPRGKDPNLRRGVENADVDVHAALRDGGCRLVGSSLDFDDIYTDKPDDAILNVSSILRILGQPQQSPPIPLRRSPLSVETITYCLWAACNKSLSVFSYVHDKEEEEAAREERECYALQLFMAELGASIIELLPPHGVLYVPVDPRLSNNVVDTIHYTLYLLEAFGEVGADLHRLVFDIPATHAGIHAGHILSLEHNLNINYTLVCDLSQAAACLSGRPYGLSMPVRSMKRVGDERARINGVNIHPFGGIRPSTTLHFSNSQMDSVRHGLVDVSISGKGRSSAPEQDIRDHPAFETIRSIGRLVAIHTPDVLVSARDVDSRRLLYALKGVHTVSLTQECLVHHRWHAYLNDGSHIQSLYYNPTDAQRRRADDRAHAIKLPAERRRSNNNTGPDGTGELLGWETALRAEVEGSTARNPKILRRYVDHEWISGCGLSDAVKKLAFAASTPGSAQPPAGFLGNLGGGGKRSVLMVMESGLEEECKAMGNLHRVLADYLENRFGPGLSEGRKRTSKETTPEA